MIYSYEKISLTHMEMEREKHTLFWIYAKFVEEGVCVARCIICAPAHKTKAVNWHLKSSLCVHSNDARVSYMKGQWMDRAIICTPNRIRSARSTQQQQYRQQKKVTVKNETKKKKKKGALSVGFSSHLQTFLFASFFSHFDHFFSSILFECACLIARNFRGF